MTAVSEGYPARIGWPSTYERCDATNFQRNCSATALAEIIHGKFIHFHECTTETPAVKLSLKNLYETVQSQLAAVSVDIDDEILSDKDSSFEVVAEASLDRHDEQMEQAESQRSDLEYALKLWMTQNGIYNSVSSLSGEDVLALLENIFTHSELNLTFTVEEKKQFSDAIPVLNLSEGEWMEFQIKAEEVKKENEALTQNLEAKKREIDGLNEKLKKIKEQGSKVEQSTNIIETSASIDNIGINSLAERLKRSVCALKTQKEINEMQTAVLTKLDVQLEKSKKEKELLQKKLEAINCSLNTAEASLRSTTYESASLSQKNVTDLSESLSLQQNVFQQTLTQEKKSHKEEIEKLSKQKQELQKQIELIKVQNSSLKEQLLSKEKEYQQTLTQERQSHKAQIDTLLKQNKELQTKINLTEFNQKDFNSKLSLSVGQNQKTLAEEKRKHESELHIILEEKESLKQEIANLKLEIKELKQAQGQNSQVPNVPNQALQSEHVLKPFRDLIDTNKKLQSYLNCIEQKTTTFDRTQQETKENNQKLINEVARLKQLNEQLHDQLKDIEKTKEHNQKLIDEVAGLQHLNGQLHDQLKEMEKTKEHNQGLTNGVAILTQEDKKSVGQLQQSECKNEYTYEFMKKLKKQKERIMGSMLSPQSAVELAVGTEKQVEAKKLESKYKMVKLPESEYKSSLSQMGHKLFKAPSIIPLTSESQSSSSPAQILKERVSGAKRVVNGTQCKQDKKVRFPVIPFPNKEKDEVSLTNFIAYMGVLKQCCEMKDLAFKFNIIGDLFDDSEKIVKESDRFDYLYKLWGVMSTTAKTYGVLARAVYSTLLDKSPEKATTYYNEIIQGNESLSLL